MDGVMNERTINVSNSRPSPMVVPTWPMVRKSLAAIEAIVNAKTRPVPGEILRILRWALLTDEEFSQPGRWADYDDPFDDWRSGPFESVSYDSSGEHPDIIRGYGADDRIGDTS